MLAAVLLFAMMIVTVIDVLGRYVFSQPLPGAFELTEIMLAIVVFSAAPLICLREEHIIVAVLTDHLPNNVREILAGTAALIAAAVLGLVAWQILQHARRLASYGDVTTFLQISKAPIGYVFAGLVMIAALASLLVSADRFRRCRAPASGSDA